MKTKLFALVLALLFPACALAESYVLAFTADWCGACQTDKPIVEKLQKEGFDIRYVNVDQRKDLASYFQVRAIPQYVSVNPYPIVTSRHMGVISENKLRRLATRQSVLIVPGFSVHIGAPLWSYTPCYSMPYGNGTGGLFYLSF